MGIWQITLMVDGRKLDGALEALEGQTIGEPQLRRLRGAARTKGGKVTETIMSGAPLHEKVAEILRRGEKKFATSKDISSAVALAGGSKGSYGYVKMKLHATGVLNKRLDAKHGGYEINKGEVK